jgi:hypothetical protein
VACELVSELTPLKMASELLAENLEGGLSELQLSPPMPIVQALKGRPAQQPGFFEAAAAFYGFAPWLMVDDTPLRIDAPEIPGGPVYAVIMGQAGQAEGVAIYETLDELLALFDSDRPDEFALSRQIKSLALVYGPAEETPEEDVKAVEEGQWALFASHAYPSILKLDPEGLDEPTVVEMAWLHASLWGILALLGERVSLGRNAAGETVYKARVNLDEQHRVNLEMSWVDLDEELED